MKGNDAAGAPQLFHTNPPPRNRIIKVKKLISKLLTLGFDLVEVVEVTHTHVFCQLSAINKPVKGFRARSWTPAGVLRKRPGYTRFPSEGGCSGSV